MGFRVWGLGVRVGKVDHDQRLLGSKVCILSIVEPFSTKTPISYQFSGYVPWRLVPCILYITIKYHQIGAGHRGLGSISGCFSKARRS